MSVSMFDQFFKANQAFNFFEPIFELNKITMRLYGDAAKEQTKAINELLRCHAEQLQQLSHAKRWEEIMEIQANWAANAASPLNELTQAMIESCMNMNSHYAKWLEKGFQKASDINEEKESNLSEKTAHQTHHKR
ncbi:MAG: phasin family protein [Proteobacteria bacterium]|nr:phasin family protein [Pseudomonadota bacterium]